MTDNQIPANQSSPRGPALLLFWTAAALMMFVELGSTSLWGSEDRWAEISRNMILFKDFVHPAINGTIYFDKPLLSYWAIAIPGLTVGVVNEFIVRLPSAIAGLIGLWATFKLGETLWNRRTALFSAWIMLCCMGFIFWARKGAADLENMAAIILAVCWYFGRKDKPGFMVYFVFMLICIVGAHFKGIPAIAVPAIVILPDLLRNNNWKKHLRWSFFAAAVLCLGIYLLPFLLASITALPTGWHYPETFDGLKIPQWANAWQKEICGLYLVWKENFVRAADPFDHKDEPFFCYSYHVLRIVAPWVVIFVAALYFAIRDYRKSETPNRWLLEAVVLILLLFSASASRRWYYILPIVPFCALLMGAYICNSSTNGLKKWLYELHKYAALTATALLCLTIPAFFAFHALTGNVKSLTKFQEFILPLPGMIVGTILATAMLAAWMIYRRQPAKFDWIIDAESRQWSPLLINIWLLMFIFSCIFPSMIERYRTEKAFALELKKFCAIRNVQPEELAFYAKPATKVVFYMEFKQAVPEAATPKEIEALMSTSRPPRFIITQNRYNGALKEALQEYKAEPAVLQEKVFAWEKEKEKLSVWKFTKQGKE